MGPYGNSNRPNETSSIQLMSNYKERAMVNFNRHKKNVAVRVANEHVKEAAPEAALPLGPLAGKNPG